MEIDVNQSFSVESVIINANFYKNNSLGLFHYAKDEWGVVKLSLVPPPPLAAAEAQDQKGSTPAYLCSRTPAATRPAATCRNKTTN